MSSDAPAPVTKRRRWRAVVEFDVDDTPDPAYDVAANDRLADDLVFKIGNALASIGAIESPWIDEVAVIDS